MFIPLCFPQYSNFSVDPSATTKPWVHGSALPAFTPPQAPAPWSSAVPLIRTISWVFLARGGPFSPSFGGIYGTVGHLLWDMSLWDIDHRRFTLGHLWDIYGPLMMGELWIPWVSGHEANFPHWSVTWEFLPYLWWWSHPGKTRRLYMGTSSHFYG